MEMVLLYVYTMKEGGAIILAVVLLLPPASCSGDAVFVVKEKLLCLGSKRGHN